jgi:hypothetical protein
MKYGKTFTVIYEPKYPAEVVKVFFSLHPNYEYPKASIDYLLDEGWAKFVRFDYHWLIFNYNPSPDMLKALSRACGKSIEEIYNDDYATPIGIADAELFFGDMFLEGKKNMLKSVKNKAKYRRGQLRAHGFIK